VSKSPKIHLLHALAELVEQSCLLAALRDRYSSAVLVLCILSMHSAAGSEGHKAKRVRTLSAKASESTAAGTHTTAVPEDVKAIKEAKSPASVKQPSAEMPSYGEETTSTGAAASSPRTPVTLEVKVIAVDAGAWPISISP
jgi:uncharacterized lipoprotein NlpE involved in copper resistance